MAHLPPSLMAEDDRRNFFSNRAYCNCQVKSTRSQVTEEEVEMRARYATSEDTVRIG